MTAWPDDLGMAILSGRFLLMLGDGPDEDRAPDIRAAAGATVRVVPNAARVTYRGGDGTAMLFAQPTEGVLDADGWVCTRNESGGAGLRNLVVPATDSDRLSPTGFSYLIEIRAGGQTVTFHIAAPAGETIDLAAAAPVPSSGGTAVVVDTATADRAVAAADRAERIAQDVADNVDQIVADYLATAPDLRGEDGAAGRGIASISDPDADSRVTITFTDGSTATVQAIRGADGHTPAITWEGTSIVVDGEQGPDLKGEPGADSTVPGPAPTVSWDGDRLVVEGVTGPSLTGPDGPAPTVAWSGDRLVVGGVQGPALTGPASTVPGPPGAVPTSTDYVVVGPGRPDVPAGTGYTSAQLTALPVGAEYRSTDGAGVGAWRWGKTTTGWVVTNGDTGWRTISDGGSAGILGAGHTLRLRRVTTAVEMRLNVNQNPAVMPDYSLPAGFAPYGMDLQRAMYRGGTTAITGYYRINSGKLTFNGGANSTNATALETWTTTDPWPATLPGTAI